FTSGVDVQHANKLPHRLINPGRLRRQIGYEALVAAFGELFASDFSLRVCPHAHTGYGSQQWLELSGVFSPDVHIRVRGKKTLDQRTATPLPSTKNKQRRVLVDRCRKAAGVSHAWHAHPPSDRDVGR